MIPAISSLPLPHKYILIKGSYPFHKKNPCNKILLQLKSPLPNLPLLQKRLKRLLDSKSRGGAEKMKSKVFACNAEGWQVQQDTCFQGLFHSVSVALLEHPPTPGLPQIAVSQAERMLSDFRAVSHSRVALSEDKPRAGTDAMMGFLPFLLIYIYSIFVAYISIIL